MLSNKQKEIKAKEHFVSPTVEIIVFSTADIITTSRESRKLTFEFEGEVDELDW